MLHSKRIGDEGFMKGGVDFKYNWREASNRGVVGGDRLTYSGSFAV